MFYANNIQDTRALFFTAWQKYRKAQHLSPLEHQIASVIAEHPEYQHLFDNPQRYLESDWSEGPNPFMHLGLHLAIRDQLATNRPQGIDKVYQAVLKKLADPLEVEHLFMEKLATCLWEAQREGQFPDENRYLQNLQILAGISDE